jgi:hypothetical protein
VIKFTGAVTPSVTHLSGPGDPFSAVGGFAPQYLSDDTKIIAPVGILVNNDSSSVPTTLTMSINVLGGTIAKVYLSTPGFNYNALPLSSITTTNTIVLNFGSNNIYSDYISPGAVFFIDIKWQ